jgi:vanillate O-demethylase monooxygenase subunit
MGPITEWHAAMNWLRNIWYQAGWSSEVGTSRPLLRTILNEPILFYRTADGALAALLDRCPHRFAPLSAGMIENDRVVCGYHGLAFGSDGACVRNPHGAITSAMKVKSFPVVERYSAFWIWMGDADIADSEKIPNLSFIDDTPEKARIYGNMPTMCNYQLLTDNILDLSHADYLHPTTLGGIITNAKAMSREVDGTIIAEWQSVGCEPPNAYRPMVPTGLADIWTRVVWQAPALMVLDTGAKPAGIAPLPEDHSFTLHNMVPETETSSHYFFCVTRRFDVENEELTQMLRTAVTQAFKNEDKPMLEQQQARMGSADFWALGPILLKSDAAAVRARRMLEKLISSEASNLAP